MSLRELTQLCQETTGTRIKIGIASEERQGDVPWYCTDNSKVKSATGWVPTKTPGEIVVDTCRWMTKDQERLRPFLASRIG